MSKGPRGRKRQSRRSDQPDVPAMRKAIREFLRGAGIEIEGTDLEKTPRRVARAWTESFLDGYRADPAVLFAETYRVSTGPKSTELSMGQPRSAVFSMPSLLTQTW